MAAELKQQARREAEAVRAAAEAAGEGGGGLFGGLRTALGKTVQAPATIFSGIRSFARRDSAAAAEAEAASEGADQQ
jgi:hypothetical protein